MWSPAALNVASVLLCLFLASALMSWFAIVVTVPLLLEARAVWDKTFQAAIIAAEAAARQLATCDQEMTTLRAEKAQMKRDFEDLEREYVACTISLAEARQQVKRSELYYEREQRREGEPE